MNILKKQYEIITGEIGVWKYREADPYVPPTHNGVGFLALPAPKGTDPREHVWQLAPIATKRIALCKTLGFSIGSKVIRRSQATKDRINNPIFIGRVDRFLMQHYIGHTNYYPMLVRYTNLAGEDRFMPMDCEELELYPAARARLGLSAIPELSKEEELWIENQIKKENESKMPHTPELSP